MCQEMLRIVRDAMFFLFIGTVLACLIPSIALSVFPFAVGFGALTCALTFAEGILFY